MAEEQQLAPAEGVEAPIDAPDPQDTSPAPRTVEDFARDLGWKPKEEFVGPEDGWRDAESFVRFGVDRNKDLFNEVRSLRDTTDRMARTQASLTEQAVERARMEERGRWEQRHREAVETGDLSTATQAVQKIAELTAAPTQPSNAPQNDPTVMRFVADNAWFERDPSAKAVAIAEADAVARRGGGVPEQLEAARTAVHKRFPEYAPQQAKAAPSVAQPARVAGNRSSKKGFADMPVAAQDACRELVKRGYATTEGYVANYFDKGAA